MLRVRCRRLEQPIVQIFLAEGSEQRARFGRNAIAITARAEHFDLRPRRDDTRVMQHGPHVGLGGAPARVGKPIGHGGTGHWRFSRSMAKRSRYGAKAAPIVADTRPY